jgi:hypothetical protein
MVMEAGSTNPPGGSRGRCPGLQSVPPGASASGTRPSSGGGVGRGNSVSAADDTHVSRHTGKERVARRPQRQGVGDPGREGSPGGRLPGVGRTARLLFAVCRLPLFSLFDCPTGFSAHPQPDGASPRRTGHSPAWGGRDALPGQHPAARDGAERWAAVLRDSRRALVLLQCRGSHHGGAEPSL